MVTLYSQNKNTVEAKIEYDGSSYTLSTDRMFASFDTMEEVHSFAEDCKEFISNLHKPKHPNNAGFFFMFGPGFGKGSRSSQLAVFTQAISGEADPENPLVVLADNCTEDDMADAWMLMTRQWLTSDLIGECDGTYEGFRKFFMTNSEDLS